MSVMMNMKTVLLHEVLPWILPKKIHESVVLFADVDNARKVKTLRFLLSTLLKHQSLQQNHSKIAASNHIIQNIQLQNIHLAAQLNEIQRCLNSVATQCRLQQEDHFELERRLMEFKFGQDPLLMSSDSVFENCSNISLGDISIDMRNIETSNTGLK